MIGELTRKAYGVLFPVLETLHLSEHIARFLDRGGKSLLFGETGEEYSTGRMSQQRLQRETLQAWHGVIEDAKNRAGSLIFAADADIAAVHRLEGFARKLPDRESAQCMQAAALEEICFEMGRGVAATGINLVLSPTADVVTGRNEWLQGRTLADDPEVVTQMVRAYVRGVRRAGLSATLKHFPGHPECSGHPARDAAVVPCSLSALKSVWSPFRAGIEEGVEAVMMGPAQFNAVTPAKAGSLSGTLISILRTELGFGGLVMTCDLDHKATIGQASLGDTAVAALNAGADLLLLSPKAATRLDEVAASIVRAVSSGTLNLARLEAAYAKVCAQADR